MKIRNLAIVGLLAMALSSLTACGGGKSSSNAATAASAAPMSGAMQNGVATTATPPNCGAVKAVWVNLSSKVYHEPSSPWYGKTKHGEYLCPSQAKKEGFRPAGAAAQ